ncbi:MAG: ATP-dependent protease ATPase subunit HslU [Treponema sp.]|nr:ATP-dependent protease ATPase subunit HslU [Treponema sp.]
MSEKIDLTPSEIVEKLDTYIIGQKNAKRAVAVALRNRFRRLHLSADIRDEVAPKNILLIGPTGVGKTEIARRLAKLCNAPFLKVEATKYTEIGYVGRDVESMVRDLMAVGYNDVKAEIEETMREKSVPRVEEKLLDLLLPGSSPKVHEQEEVNPLGFMIEDGTKLSDTQPKKPEQPVDASTREKFREMLREGKLEDREVELSVKNRGIQSMGVIAGGNMEDFEKSLSNVASLLGGGRHRRTLTVKEARKILTQETLDEMIDSDKVAEIALKRVEESGIIFIDEIDKIAVRGEAAHGADVSREGVQRDILPIVEGSNVNTKYGVVDTTHILFIAAGAFSLSSPSDLIPELQGRFPLRVELESLHADEFRRILLEPKNALTKQYIALLATEGVTLEFTDSAISRMSVLAEEVNAHSENIGARRLHTIMEKVIDDISFDADKHSGETIVIDDAFVDKRLQGITENQDLSRYIL